MRTFIGSLLLVLLAASAPARAWDPTTSDHVLEARQRLRAFGGSHYERFSLTAAERSRFVPEFAKTMAMRHENLQRAMVLGRGPLVDRMLTARSERVHRDDLRRFVREAQLTSAWRLAAPVRLTAFSGGIRVHARLK